MQKLGVIGTGTQPKQCFSIKVLKDPTMRCKDVDEVILVINGDKGWFGLNLIGKIW